ncbi:hypothetical protein QBC38DRAFT_448652 [Podospora fimiseda]|uniref:Heterokaryon incompatibility domain-containing protein n=1 Tax=Podospora fimiseda TaxID=252190 RepID=A0AAN7BGM0_9PEZI|nr:hypothetical protein QBC38DRAFT_448652 [Podospora fimiseda]
MFSILNSSSLEDCLQQSLISNLEVAEDRVRRIIFSLSHDTSLFHSDLELLNVPDQTRKDVLDACISCQEPLRNLRYGLRDICNNLYWNRVWILQEIVLAKRVYLTQGHTTVPWDRFKDFILPNPWEMWHSGQGAWWGMKYIMETSDLPALVSLIQCRDGYRVLQGKSQKLSLRTLIELFRHKHCTNPLDKVYGILGLSEQQIPIDYAKNQWQVYFDVLHACLQADLIETGPIMANFCMILHNSLDVYHTPQPSDTAAHSSLLNSGTIFYTTMSLKHVKKHLPALCLEGKWDVDELTQLRIDHPSRKLFHILSFIHTYS